MGTSFAQEWSNKTGGYTTAVIGQTSYTNINVWDKTLFEKIGNIVSRWGRGYNESGSKYLPGAASGASWNIFSPN